MKDTLLRSFVVLALAVCVPFQAAFAVSAGQHAALEQCHQDGHDGHDGHGKPAGTHCHECCTTAAIAGAMVVVSPSSAHDAVSTAPGMHPPGDLPAGLDRPPRSL